MRNLLVKITQKRRNSNYSIIALDENTKRKVNLCMGDQHYISVFEKENMKPSILGKEHVQ